MGLYHGWSDEPDTHADFVRGGVDASDFDDEPIRHRRAGKGRKCRKSKTNQKCDYSVLLEDHSWDIPWRNEHQVFKIWECSRCGRHHHEWRRYKVEYPS